MRVNISLSTVQVLSLETFRSRFSACFPGGSPVFLGGKRDSPAQMLSLARFLCAVPRLENLRVPDLSGVLVDPDF